MKAELKMYNNQKHTLKTTLELLKRNEESVYQRTDMNSINGEHTDGEIGQNA